MKQSLGRTRVPSLCLAWICMLLAACSTVQEPHRADAQKLSKEASLVFLRPDRYSILGTRSIRDYIEVTYEKSGRNAADQLEVEVGLRNRGGQHFWDLKGPNVGLSMKTAFYGEPVESKGPVGPPIYETNWQPLVLTRGDTGHFKVVCPAPAGRYYQISVTDLQ